jgi:hypothetical protein
MGKAWPWIIGVIGAVSWFGYFETEAFTHPERYDTLSHVVSTLGAKWPLAIFLMGNFSGILQAHFFWPWKANPLGDGNG